MCGVRCTPNLAAYCNNGLHLTSKGRGVIFKLLHKLIFKCLITYFSVLYHGERFQIKGTFSKVHRQQKLSLFFPSFAFGKITSQLLRDNLQAPDVLLAVQHVLFTLANLPATGCTLRRRPPTILQPLPLRYIVSVCQFCLCYSSELRCKGSANI